MGGFFCFPLTEQREKLSEEVLRGEVNTALEPTAEVDKHLLLEWKEFIIEWTRKTSPAEASW